MLWKQNWMRRAAKQNAGVQIALVEEKWYIIKYILTHYCVTLRCFRLVPTCPKNRKNRRFLRASRILTISGNTASQTVGDFYDVIGRIGSIFTLKVHSRQSPTSAVFTMSVNMKFARVCIGDAWVCLFLLPNLDFQLIFDLASCLTFSSMTRSWLNSRQSFANRRTKWGRNRGLLLKQSVTHRGIF